MQFSNINGHLLHYKHILLNEEERTFVFINSVGTDFRIWEEVADTLKGEANILLFDNRGHGLSDWILLDAAVERDSSQIQFICRLSARLSIRKIRPLKPCPLPR